MKIRFSTSLTFLFLVAVAVVLTGCLDDDPPMVDDTPTLGFADEGAESVTEGEDLHSITVQLIAPHQPEDVQAAFDVVDDETTAEEGVHYTFEGEAADGVVTLPANSSHGNIDVNVMYDELEPGDSETLELELTEGLTDGVVIAENFRTHVLTIEGLAALVSTDPEALDFGELGDEELIGAGEDTTQVLTIANTGTLPSTVGNIALGGDGADQFEHDADDEYTLEPGEDVEINVTFAPEEEGEFEAEMTFMWDMGATDPEGIEQVVSLSGATADAGEDDDNGDNGGGE